MAVICKLPHKSAAGRIKYKDTFSLGKEDLQGIVDFVVEKVLNRLLGKGDVVDSLLSTATNLPLSANMGNKLSEKDKEMWCAFADLSTMSGANVDCNDYTQPGVSDILINPGYEHVLLHAPDFIPGAFYLMNICWGYTDGKSSLTQFAIPYYNTECGIGIRRRYQADRWSDWEQLITQSNLNKKDYINAEIIIGDILEVPKRFKKGFTPFLTGGTNQTLGLPNNFCYFSYGFAIGEPSNGIFAVCVFERNTGEMYMNSYYDGYHGWRKTSTQAL